MNSVDETRMVSVKISPDLYQDVLATLEDNKGFSSVDDFVNYAVRMAIGKKPQTLSEEDTEAVAARLKALGYI